jgi:hypothetical protein
LEKQERFASLEMQHFSMPLLTISFPLEALIHPLIAFSSSLQPIFLLLSFFIPLFLLLPSSTILQL